jgi:hypothetical protein
MKRTSNQGKIFDTMLERYSKWKHGILMSPIAFPLLYDGLFVWEGHLALSSQMKASTMITFIRQHSNPCTFG